MNELVDKWLPTGFLDDVPLEHRSKAAQFFHEVGVELIMVTPEKDGPPYERLNKMCAVVLPVAHDLFMKTYPHTPDPAWVVEHCGKFFDEKQELYEALKAGIAQDHDREFASICYDTLASKLAYERNPTTFNQTVK